MRSIGLDTAASGDAWQRAAALALLALFLASAVLDRRNGLSVEMAGMPKVVAAPSVPLTTDELIREMLTHD